MRKIFRIQSKYTRWDMIKYTVCNLGKWWKVVTAVILIILAASWAAFLGGIYFGGSISLALQMVLITIIWFALPCFSGLKLYKRMKKSRTGVDKEIIGYEDKIVANNHTTGEQVTGMTADVEVTKVFKEFLVLHVNKQLLIIKRNDFVEGSVEELLALYGVDHLQ